MTTYSARPTESASRASCSGPIRESQTARVRVRAEHAERDRAEIRAMGLELGGELFVFGHDPPRREWRCH
jgi:hypothetical protein